MLPNTILEAYPNTRFTTKQYDQLKKVKIKIKDLDTATKKLHEMMLRIISDQKISKETPLALFLSGGVDSSLIGYFLKELGYNITGYTIGTKDSEDIPAGKAVADFLKIEQKVILIDENETIEILSELPDDIQLADDLSIASSILITKLMDQIKEDGFHHVFAGNNADEPMGGGLNLDAGLTHNDYWEYKLPQLKARYVKEDNVNIYGQLAFKYGLFFYMPFEDFRYNLLAKQIDATLFFDDKGNDKIPLRKLAADLNLPLSTRKKDMFQNSAGILQVVTKRNIGW